MYKGKNKQKKKVLAVAASQAKLASKASSTSSVAAALSALYLAGKAVVVTAQSVANTTVTYVAPVVTAAVNATLTGNYSYPYVPTKPEVCYNDTVGAPPKQVVPCVPTPCETGCIVGVSLAATVLAAGTAALLYKAGVFNYVKEKCSATATPTEESGLVNGDTTTVGYNAA